jgi:methylmalonyl-CoA mutase
VLGGCDSMQVGAFDEVVREPDDFSLRLARNTQLVLQRECQLDRVIDPAGGSWCIESLTAELANKAWALFQEVQKQGGMAAAMQAGFPQKAVAATAAEKLNSVSVRKESLVGVNQYANASEKFLDTPVVDAKAFHQRRAKQVAAYRTSLEDAESDQVLGRLSKIVELSGAQHFEACVAAVSAGATLGEVARASRMLDTASEHATAVCITRAAVPFEKLRLAMNQAIAQGRKPRVFLLNMGGLKDYKARADFSRGFFAAGGYEVISPEGFATPEAAVAAFIKSGAEIAVICSTDDKYPTLVPKLTADIRAEKPEKLIVLAGFPKDQIEAHKASGVNEFIHIRADAAALLAKCHAKLGISI